MKNTFLLSFFLVFSYASLTAQPISKASYETMIILAEEAMATNDYVNALEQYELAYEDREDPDLVPILAELKYQIRDYRGAERLYSRLLRKDPENIYAEQRFNYARVLKMQGKYDEAIQEFQTYLSQTTDETKKAMAQKELNGAELGMSGGGSTKGVEAEAIKNRKLNTKVSQYSPALSPSGRVFYYSSWAGKGIITADDADDPEQFARIFSSQIDEDGKYEDPEPLGPEINRPGYNSVNVSLSPDGNRMYFNRILLTGNVVSESKIYMSEGGDGAWKSANEVVGVNGDYSALQPAVGDLYGKEVLFFVSDMEGGQGGKDIYYATHQGEGVYGDPINLGPSINTAGDEKTPFWFDGTLYFSTDGRSTLGGKDIFYAVWNGTNWSEAENMGPAYNGAADDAYFRLYDEGYKGYFTSNRIEGASAHAKGCCDNIYAFGVPRQYVDLIVGTFSDDEGNKAPLMGVTVQLVDNGLAAGTEGTQSLTMANGNVFKYGLDFERPYTIVATHPDYFPDTVTFNTNGVVDSKTFEQRMYLNPKPTEPIYEEFIIDQPIEMENIIYDFDDDRITEQAEIDLQYIYQLMVDSTTLKIELGSHTDIRGEDNYNKDLSQRRTESARRWLMRKGIARDRINVQGYGETVPKTVTAKLAKKIDFLEEGDILTEAFINNLETEEQREQAHEQNRRTEIKIIEGPTSIRIKTIREKTTEENERGSNIGNTSKAPRQGDLIEVSKMSSLYGQKNLKGLPIMQFESRTYDVGKVTKGDKRSFSYIFTNNGEGNLIIDLISACDCTTTNQDDLVGKTFEPGDSATIEVVFDSADKDESETIDVDIYLRNDDNDGNPIMEMIRYDFEM